MSPPRGGGDMGVVKQQCKKIFDIDIFMKLRNINYSIEIVYVLLG